MADLGSRDESKAATPEKCGESAEEGAGLGDRRLVNTFALVVCFVCSVFLAAITDAAD